MTPTIAKAELPAAYWRLVWAAAVDNIGDGAFAAAVPLLAVTITHDPLQISIISAATYLPWLIFSLPAGAMVDRHDRGRLMWRSQALQAVIVGVMAVLAASGDATIPALGAMGFLLGGCEVVFANAAQAILPDIVPQSLLHKANANQYTVATVGQEFGGPPIGSLLFAVAAALPFGLDAFSFGVSAALLATVPGRARARNGRSVSRRAMAEGIRWLAGHWLLRTLALLLGVNTFCFQMGNVTLVLLATQSLHVSVRGYGLLLAGAAIGSVTGGLVNARIVARTGPLPALLTALAASALLYLGIAICPDAATLGALLALTGFATMMWRIVTVSLRQQIVPSQLLGRVNSVYRMVGWGLMPLGGLAGGLVAQQFGVRAAYLGAGILRSIALVVALPVLVASVGVGSSARKDDSHA